MKSLFPATYSTLCTEALASFISEKYRAGDVQCKLLVRGVGDTYLVESPAASFILRIYRSTHRSLPQIRDEITLLLTLKQAGIAVSYPIADASGEVIQELDAVEGKRYGVLFSYAPGVVVKTLNENQLLNFGAEVARFHNISSAVSLGNARWQFDTDTTLFRPLEMLRSAFSEDPESYIWLQQMAQLAQKKLTQLSASGFSKGYCHFDFLPKNVHFEGDLVTFFDFDFMGYGWLVNDIMTFWQHLILDIYTGRTTRQAALEQYAIFLKGYRQHRSVSEDELSAVPYLSLGFWLFYMGFHTTHDQFYAFIQPSHLKGITVFLKNMVETCWDKEENITTQTK